mmetsp:Transcript_8708/g.19754  ORF Transcript_8708/g.19754 Transcript_8708/m.19754 type:complete len:109 (-) Transcript_8708:106-432(-)
MLVSMLWNAASNDVGVHVSCTQSYCDGSRLVGGPSLDEIGHLGADELSAKMSKLGAGLGIGVGYGKDGGRGVTSGKGWDSHGSVTCHSYGCQANFAKSGRPTMTAAFK